MKPVFTALMASAAVLTAADAMAAPDVVVSIKPIHSLVAAVMEGVAEPKLIVEGAASPHTYTMKPSNARAIQDADIVFWIGPNMEAFLDKPLDALSKSATVVALGDAPGLEKLPFREGGAFEAHDDGDEHEGHAHGAEHAGDDHGHDHGDHDADHAEKHDDHAAEAHDHAGEEHHDHAAGEAHADHDTTEAHADHDAEEAHADHGHEHSHEGFDTHLWLDPMNAKAMTKEIEAKLIAADPANIAVYNKNTLALMKKLDALDAELKATVEPVKDKPFVVFHDAYQYFEHRYDIRVAGSITVSPETTPGAERLSEIHKKLVDLGATCVFAEPQFTPKLINVVTEGTKARAGVLDPEGASLTEGPNLYFELMRNLGNALTGCLSRDS